MPAPWKILSKASKKLKARFGKDKEAVALSRAQADQGRNDERDVAETTKAEPVQENEFESSTQISLDTSSVRFEPPIKRFTNDSNGPWSSVALSDSHLPVIAAQAASTSRASSDDPRMTVSSPINQTRSLNAAIPKASSDDPRITSSSPIEEKRDLKVMMPTTSSGTSKQARPGSSNNAGRGRGQSAPARSNVHSGVSPSSDHSSSRPRPREPELESAAFPKSLRSSFNTMRDFEPVSPVSPVVRQGKDLSTIVSVNPSTSISTPTEHIIPDLTSNTDALYESEAVESEVEDFLVDSPSASPENGWDYSFMGSSSSSPDDDSIAASSYQPSPSISDIAESTYI